MLETLLLFDDRMIEHDPGPGHPERPDRLRAIDAMLSLRTTSRTRLERATPASEASVARVHSGAHLVGVRELEGRYGSLDEDTHVSPDSVSAAWLAAGAATTAVDAVCRGEVRNAFALVRPPGHHATASDAMGFCLFNNVAVAAAHAKAVHGKQRALIVDWDVHHGNGTEAIFYGVGDPLFFSIHQYPFYPGTGARTAVGTGAGEGFTVNVPMGEGANDADYAFAFANVLEPIAEAYRPDIVLVSAGFDAHRNDPLGGMQLTEDGFAALCGQVMRIAQRHAEGRMVMLLEGGYDLAGLAKSVHACIDVLAESTPPEITGARTGHGERDVLAALEVQRRHWKI